MKIDNHALRSYDDIAREFGISRGRVIQIEQRALKKLRKAFVKLGIFSLKDGRDSVFNPEV